MVTSFHGSYAHLGGGEYAHFGADRTRRAGMYFVLVFAERILYLRRVRWPYASYAFQNARDVAIKNVSDSWKIG